MKSRSSPLKEREVAYFFVAVFVIYSLFAFGIVAFILSYISSIKIPFFEGMENKTEDKKEDKKTKKEGMSNLSLTPYPQVSVDTSKWRDDSYEVVRSKMDSYPNTSMKDTNVFFKNNQFSPSCCANTPYYSNSAGCMCMTTEQKRFLTTRGGNNTPFHTI